MKYILITSQGRVMTFYLKGMAETYQGAYGGVVVQEHEIEDCELVDMPQE
jgi:hypothetical protein